MLSFIWFTIVVVGILLISLAMISMGAACWDDCYSSPTVPEYLVTAGSIFFVVLIVLLLVTFCICTSSGDPKVAGTLKIVYGVSVAVMYLLVLIGSTVLFVQGSEDHENCNKTLVPEGLQQYMNTTSSVTPEPFCGSTLEIFSYSVLVIIHLLLFFSLLVTFHKHSK